MVHCGFSTCSPCRGVLQRQRANSLTVVGLTQSWPLYINCCLCDVLFNHTSARHVPHVPRKLANANTLGRNCCSASPKVFTHQPLTERVRCRYLPLRMCCESRIHLRRRVVAHRSELCCSEALANYFSFVVAKKLEKIRLQREIRAAHYGWCFKLGCLFTSQLDSARHHG